MFTRVRGGCDNQRCHNKKTRSEMRPEALRILKFEKKKNKQLVQIRVGSRFLVVEIRVGSRFLVLPQRDQLGSTKCAMRLLSQ